jgi:3-hydroxyacyl-[acyl-carrier-protein] dehydratase
MKELIEKLPYGPDFLFVDEILSVDENTIVGSYTFRTDALFYRDHFPARPITPGVILIETMAQIGLVCFGFYLEKDRKDELPAFAFTNSLIIGIRFLTHQTILTPNPGIDSKAFSLSIIILQSL